MIFSDWRRLTENEVRMAKQVFADSIDFHHIKIYRGIPLIPNANTAIAPNGNIYFPRKHCPDDFTQAGIAYKIWLIHELTHVWQHQRGHKVWLSGLFIMLKGGYRKRKSLRLPYPLTPHQPIKYRTAGRPYCSLFRSYFSTQKHLHPATAYFSDGLSRFSSQPTRQKSMPKILVGKKTTLQKAE